MHLLTHFLTGWAVSLPMDLETRDRGLIAFASISPDLDGIVVIGDLVQGRSLDSCYFYATYHHVLCHNLLFAVVAALVLGSLARRKLPAGSACLLAIHIHYLADLVGSAGPDGSIWEIHYLYPFTDGGMLSVTWQWALNAWPNIALTVGLITVALYKAWKHGISPIGIFSVSGDQAFVAALRQRFGDESRS